MSGELSILKKGGGSHTCFPGLYGLNFFWIIRYHNVRQNGDSQCICTRLNYMTCKTYNLLSQPDRLSDRPQHLEPYRIQGSRHVLAGCYAPRYGFWRPYITDAIYRYLECGDFN